ncbi:LysR family transcriptional regulator [Lichenihabitans sp. Uapishka_5]|uniref:LysR family transcriptional regulator n=1 Tax=Lichenihabitans sp. Uapishka_5 TaxID=3037302 RepID=UPI0029E81DE7|nr:LysR family transcriptional regulator [Lichenihabitans sp. Uapishka_5]MDX7953589.1 LysR family transcriptional regulator [Lichenihabitans sp. Uapishka_5]
MRSLDLNDLRLLMQVIEHGSYTAASRINGIPKSTISQRITALEKAIGTGLLRRTSRSFSLTEAGALLLPHARAIEGLARTIEQALLDHGDSLAGTLRVSCSNALAQFALSPLVPCFLDRHPEIHMRVEASNRLVDLVGEGYDMAIRGHVAPLKDSTLIQRVVARTPWSIAASPDWIRTHGAPATPDELAKSALLHFATSADPPQWTLRSGDVVAQVSFKPRVWSDDMASLRSSAIAGGGIVALPTYVLAPALAAGRLVVLLTAWSLPVSSISVLTPPKAQSSRLAAAFSDHLRAELPWLIQHVDATAPGGSPDPGD